MKKILIAVLCAGLLATAWSAEKKSSSVKWESDVQTAQKTITGAKKKFIFLFFTAPAWCGPCRKLESGAIASAKFVKLAQKNAAVKVDFSDRAKVSEQGQKLLKDFGVRGFPTMIVLDANGKEKGRIVGYRPEKKFFAELKKLMK